LGAHLVVGWSFSGDDKAKPLIEATRREIDLEDLQRHQNTCIVGLAEQVSKDASAPALALERRQDPQVGQKELGRALFHLEHANRLPLGHDDALVRGIEALTKALCLHLLIPALYVGHTRFHGGHVQVVEEGVIRHGG
jgi:hypothetical protein